MRPKELLIAASAPQQPEILVKLAGPWNGKPEAGTEVRWEGVPSAFSRSPFLLTMDAENLAVQVLKTTPCGAAPRKK